MILDEAFDRHQRDKDQFRQRMIAANLSQAKTLMKAFAEEDDQTHAEPIDWDAHDFRPQAHSAEELEDMMTGLKTLGFSLGEMGAE